MTATATTPATPTARSSSPAHTLDQLHSYTFDELEALYRAASAPTTLRALDGALIGRMLAWRGVGRGVLAGWLRRRALSPRFVWSGKTFAAADDASGSGVNRIVVERLLGRQNMFPFASRIDRSLFDDRPTVVIDYDRPANPWFMRRIHDEIRQLAPGLFLGLDMWKANPRSIGLVWFALDARWPPVSAATTRS